MFPKISRPQCSQENICDVLARVLVLFCGCCPQPAPWSPRNFFTMKMHPYARHVYQLIKGGNFKLNSKKYETVVHKCTVRVLLHRSVCTCVGKCEWMCHTVCERVWPSPHAQPLSTAVINVLIPYGLRMILDICTHTHTYTCTYTHTHICTYKCTYTYTHTHTYTYTHTCTYAHSLSLLLCFLS